MGLALLDRPDLLETLFYPRAASAVMDGRNGIYDGTVDIDEEVALGFRLYAARPEYPVIVFFHGNGEIASNYNPIAPMFHQIGTSLVVFDYRGYGWSTGTPTVTHLLHDAHQIHQKLPAVLARAGLEDSPRVLMGRSLGSAPAIEIAANFTSDYRGLIIESGFASILPLIARRGFSPDILQGEDDPVGNERKMRSLNLALLVIHGEEDHLIRVDEGQKLYDASPAEIKMLLRLPGLGHNNLLLAQERYFNKIRAFLNLSCSENENIQ